ncbi:MAG: uroporphyrinogen decarboxylase family protein [Planctomycetota bacterium]
MSSGWTGRKRLLTAFRGGVPDRVPVNTYEIAARDSRDWYARQPSYRRLLEFIREHTDAVTNWNPKATSELYISSERFLSSDYPLEIETRTEAEGRVRRTTRIAHTPKGDLRSVAVEDPEVFTTWQVEHWCKSVEDVDRALSVPYEPAAYDASDLPRVLEELGEHGIVMASIADPAYAAADLMSFEDFLVWAYEETEHFARTVEIVAERVFENLRRELDCCVLDAYRICGPEYFTPPYLPPEFFRRFVVPHVKRMVEMIHARGALVRLHCHGRIGRVLDLLLETGCDGIDPCEPPPDGDIELADLKRKCAPRGVSIWGNLELRLLETASAERVREEVRRIMEAAKEGGGLVVLPTAAPISADLAPRTERNYRAFIETCLELGEY